jgi:hypothetical protein
MVCLEQNTVGNVMFDGGNASRTNWLQVGSQPAECAFHVVFPRSKMLRGHRENSLLLISGASWAIERAE